jgi:hypothetical protein
MTVRYDATRPGLPGSRSSELSLDNDSPLPHTFAGQGWF